MLRFRELRQSELGAGRDPGYEWVSDWHEATQGSAEATKGRQ